MAIPRTQRSTNSAPQKRSCITRPSKVDVVVAGAGTCGIITGISCGLKKHNPNIMLGGVGPLRSVLIAPETLNQIEAEYKADGIGCDFVPCVLKQDSVDL
jgi:cystathionine beta-synthase